MDSTLFSIVCFIDDNTVECVPKSWINNEKCAWPSKHTANARKMIEKNYKPNKNEFDFYKIRELCSNIKTLAEAKSKARLAQFTSDLSDDNSYSKKKKLKRNPPSSTECPIYSDSDGNEILIIPENYGKKNKDIQEKLPSLKSDKLLIPTDVSYKSQANFIGKGSSWSPSPLKKQWSHSPKRNKALTLEISPSFTKASQLITDASYGKVKRNLFEISSEHSPSPLKKQMTLSPKRNKALTLEKSPSFTRGSQLITDASYGKGKRNLFEISSDHSPSPLKKQMTLSPKRNKVNVSNNMATNKFVLKTSTDSKSKSTNEDCTINDTEFKKQLLRNIMYLKVELNHVVTTQSEVLERLQSIEKQIQDKSYQDSKNVELNYMADYHLPIDNEDDLNTLEEKTLDDQELKNNLVKELSCTGGKNVKSAVKRIMSKLFSNSFLSQYSFTGKKGKKKFCNLFLLPIILKSIKRQLKFKTISDHEIEEPIKTYLAQAPFAEKRKKTID